MGKTGNISDDFWPYKNKKFILKAQNIEKDHKILIDKSLDTKNYIKNNLSKYTP